MSITHHSADLFPPPACCVSPPSFPQSLFTSALPGHWDGRIFRVARRRRTTRVNEEGELLRVQGGRGKRKRVAWHFHMRRHGSQVSAVRLRRGICCRFFFFLRWVNRNATHTHRHHGAAAGNTVLCCCIINKSSVLDHLSRGLRGVRRDATTPRQTPIRSRRTTRFLRSRSKFKPVDLSFNVQYLASVATVGGEKCQWWRCKQEDDH